VVSVCCRGASPSILFRDPDGVEFRLKTNAFAANIATRLLDKAYKKPFSPAQLAAQNEVVASQIEARTVQPHEAPTASPSRGRKITDGDISINGRDAAFLRSCGVVSDLEVANPMTPDNMTKTIAAGLQHLYLTTEKGRASLEGREAFDALWTLADWLKATGILGRLNWLSDNSPVTNPPLTKETK